MEEIKPDKTINGSTRFAKLLFVVFIIFIVYQTYHNIELSNKYDRLLVSFEKDFRSVIDLTIKTFQTIPHGFNISIKKVNPHLTGVNVEGMVLNLQSVDVTNLELAIEIGSKTQTINISQINSGNAAEFSVYIPDVNVNDTKTAIIDFKNSGIRFSMQK